MNKQKAISIILISLGSFLEIFYYYERFNSSGAHWSISIIQGVALTILLMGLFLLRAKWFVWIIIIPLGLYSVFNTSAGQKDSLEKKVKTESSELNTELIKDLERQRDRKLQAYEDEKNLQADSFETLQEKARWRSTASVSDETISETDSEIDSIEAEIRSLRSTTTIATTGKIEWFQVALSFFIAMMAPVGVVLWPVIKEDETDWYPLVKKWVNTNWIGIRTNKNRHIMNKDAFLDYHAVRGFTFRADLYDKILSAAIKIKCVDKNMITLDNELEAIEAILSKLRK